ncbi:hypothetical protein GWI33_009845 [Rhynchophorus ferrugineus]|uniref:Uncharacterized protein n=1 Tax=Rhynchophorus ferrugineus TaxID=354439 RepID=A0A834MED8_RHYFE|nr:hypothetical protein GWI33_009845 [Rhynchophorus ferrugineus]
MFRHCPTPIKVNGTASSLRLIKRVIFDDLFSDSKYLVLPSGELHIRDVGPEDGYKSYQCRTKHRLTGETRLSATKGRLVITVKFKARHKSYAR